MNFKRFYIKFSGKILKIIIVITSETMRCVSDDFIKTIDAQEKMLCAFMCEG